MSHALITAARNVAVVALLDKLTRSPALARQVVVIGGERRLGAEAAPYLLPRLVQAPSDAGDRAWPHLAFLVYLALVRQHAAARDAHTHVRPHTTLAMHTRGRRAMFHCLVSVAVAPEDMLRCWACG